MPARVRLARAGAPAAASLAVATVVPVAGSLEQAAQQTRSTVVAANSAVTAVPAAVRATARAVSRSSPRLEPDTPRVADVAAQPQVVARQAKEVVASDLKPRWLTADLNVWSGVGEDTRLLTVLDSGAKVRVTGAVRGRWAQVARGERLVWVRKAYLVRNKPKVGSSAPVSGSPCADGSSVESGLMANTVKVYRSVCAAFPVVSAWGGRSGYGEHGAGRALDIMATGSLGTAIANYVRAHAGELGVRDVIWSQQIWSVERGGEGWRYMSDRGSTTANHYDHVHVTVY